MCRGRIVSTNIFMLNLFLKLSCYSLRVGSCLLWAAFVYDVFFVFISPMIFGSSVMIDVASGSGKVSYQAKGRKHAKT